MPSASLVFWKRRGLDVPFGAGRPVLGQALDDQPPQLALAALDIDGLFVVQVEALPLLLQFGAEASESSQSSVIRSALTARFSLHFALRFLGPRTSPIR